MTKNDAGAHFLSAQKLAYSIEETVRLSGIGRTTIFAEIKAGRLVARKRGRRTIVLAVDLQFWLQTLPRNATNA